MDAWDWAPGTAAVKAAALPRADLGRTIVKEGDSGTRTYRIPVEISGHGSGQVRVYVLDPDSGRAESRLVTVRPGSDAIDVPVQVKGDTVYGDDVEHDIAVKAVHNSVWSGDVPDLERPLSKANLWVWLNIPPGSTSVDFIVPTVQDQVAEPTESMRPALHNLTRIPTGGCGLEPVRSR
jgi:hypothetical protein